MSGALERLGRFAARRPWSVIATWVSLCARRRSPPRPPSVAQLEDPFEAPGLDSHRATELLTQADSAAMGLGADIVLTPRDPAVTFFDSPGRGPTSLGSRTPSRRCRRCSARAIRPAPCAPAGGAAVESGTVSPDGRVALIRVQYPERDDLVARRPGEPQGAPRRAPRHDVAADRGGRRPVLRVRAGARPASARRSAWSVAIVILLLAFGSLVAMGLPIGTALLGLAVGAGSLSLVAYVVDIPSWAPVIGSMVGLGVGIDYALFILTRFREYLAEGRDVEDAVGRSLATAGRSVVFAGGTVVVAILGLAVARIPFITAGGIGISLVVLVMVLASITLLPALLGLAGHRVNGRRVRPRRAASALRWRRWGAHVGRHATAYAVGATVLLLALAAPVTALRLGFPDEGTMPQSRTERRAYDLIADGFGPGANGPLVIAVDALGRPDRRPAARRRDRRGPGHRRGLAAAGRPPARTWPS